MTAPDTMDDPTPQWPQRAVAWMVAAVISGGMSSWLLFEFARSSDSAMAIALGDRLWLWYAWLMAPWFYLGVQVRRLRGRRRALSVLAVVSLTVALGGALAWPLYLLELPPRQAAMGIAMLPLLQAGLIAITGLVLWIAGRWQR